jgi:ComF family protein
MAKMQIFKDIFYLFFPKVCLSCKLQLTHNERTICTLCRHDFPETCYTNVEENLLEKKFYGRIPLEEATSLFFFHKKGKIQTLIHELKYKGSQELGTFFGNWLGNEMMESDRFKTVDYIIPVPLHPRKIKKRGYNQLTKFGQAMSSHINIPFIENELIKTETTITQTIKGRLERWNKNNELFKVKDMSFFKDKHVLLIDDITTTGATLEMCAQEILKSENCKISIAVIAFRE